MLQGECEGMPTLSQDFLRKFVQLDPSNPGKSVSNPQQIIKIPNKGDAQEDQLKIPNLKQWRICWVFGLCVGNGEMIPVNSDCSHWCCSAQLIPKTCRKPVGSELMGELLQREDQNSNTLGESNSLKQNYSGRFCLLSLYPNNQVQRGGCPKLKNVGDAAFFLPLNEIKASQLIFSRIFSH